MSPQSLSQSPQFTQSLKSSSLPHSHVKHVKTQSFIPLQPGKLEPPNLARLNQSGVPEARVYRWNQESTGVLCPYCGGVHTHRGTRMSDYTNLPLYEAPCRVAEIAENLNGNGKKGTKNNTEGEGSTMLYEYQLVFGRYREISSKKDENPYWVSPSWEQEAKDRQRGGKYTSEQKVDKMLLLDNDESRLCSLYFKSSEKTAELWKGTELIQEWKLGVKWQTIGLLLRGSGVRPTSAEHGKTSHSTLYYGCDRLPRPEQTQRVLRRCELERFRLEKSSFDRGILGKVHAGLASMQLMTWYLENHVICTEEDTDNNPGLRKLKKITPPWRSPVVILMSQTSKKQWIKYADHLQARYSVHFIVRHPFSELELPQKSLFSCWNNKNTSGLGNHMCSIRVGLHLATTLLKPSSCQHTLLKHLLGGSHLLEGMTPNLGIPLDKPLIQLLEVE